MEDLSIVAFEQKIVDICNKVPISKRTMYYVLKDVANKLLEASDRECQISMAINDYEKKKAEAEQNETKKGGGE